MHVVSWQEMIEMVPEWCYDGNLVYHIPVGCDALDDNHESPCIVLEYFIFDLLTEEEIEEDDWLYVRVLMDGKIIDDVHSNFHPVQLNN